MLGPVHIVQRASAYAFVQAHHYSAVLPRLTTVCLGARTADGELGAVMTLGHGVRPLHTIAKAFPPLRVGDYLEIGKLCCHDDLPRNTESHFIAGVIKWLKTNMPERIVLFTWADGILGKPGYVYQASNFWYGGFITTETYFDETGCRLHPRTVQGLSQVQGIGHFASRALAVTQAMGLVKMWGRQFRYAYPLCSKGKWKWLRAQSPFEWRQDHYPKDADCVWQRQDNLGERVAVDSIPFTRQLYRRDGPQQSLGF